MSSRKNFITVSHTGRHTQGNKHFSNIKKADWINISFSKIINLSCRKDLAFKYLGIFSVPPGKRRVLPQCSSDTAPSTLWSGHFLFVPWRNCPQWARASSLTRHHGHAQIYHTRSDSPWRVIAPMQRPLPNKTHKRQTSMTPAGLETATSASEPPQNHPLDRVATGIELVKSKFNNFAAFWPTYSELQTKL